MTENTFYEEQKEQSLVKSTIVVKYFNAWAKIVISTQNRNPNSIKKIAYIDLFAGPGCFEDGRISTPVLILQMAVENEDLRNRLVTIFNDKDEEMANNLQTSINQIQGIESLKYSPQVLNIEVDDNLVELFKKHSLIPTLFFLDPWGYKGLKLQLISAMIKDWGCDVIFFFNFNRVNMGLPNPAVQEHMRDLFGAERTVSLKKKLGEAKSSYGREMLILEEMCQALKEGGSKCVLPFRFRKEGGRRTSHHIIFVSKHFRGYSIMKDIMAKESTSNEQGVPSFEYNPIDKNSRQPFLFQFSRPLEDLKNDLIEKYAGKSMTVKEIYEHHSIDTPYIKKNYKDVLRELYDNRIIHVQNISGKTIRKGTFSDTIRVTFPG